MSSNEGAAPSSPNCEFSSQAQWPRNEQLLFPFARQIQGAQLVDSAEEFSAALKGGIYAVIQRSPDRVGRLVPLFL